MKPNVLLPVRLIVLLTFLTLFTTPSFSQSLTLGNGRYEVGVGLGPSFFLGDLGGNHGKGTSFVKDVNLPLTKLSKGIFLNLFPAEWLGFRFAINQSRLEGIDSLIKNSGGAEVFRKRRNLTFKTNFTEAYMAMELYPTYFFEKHDGLQYKLRPYGIVGVGVFRFNPKGIYIDPSGKEKWVDLKPLRLEGQGMAEYPDRKEYKLTQIEIPMGFGVKYYLKETMYVGFEILHRKTFTDYVDDVSTNYIDPALFDNYLTPEQAIMAKQLLNRENINNPSGTRPYINDQRGNPKDNDAFFSSILRMGWRINSLGAGLSKQLKCPVFY